MACILVVDDDPSITTAIQAFLEIDGFEVIAANSQGRALDIIATTDVDVIILDVFMPGMNGLRSITEFRERAPSVPIITMSAYLFRDNLKSEDDFRRAATQSGADRFLPKPFRPKDLLVIVDSCLDGSGRSDHGRIRRRLR